MLVTNITKFKKSKWKNDILNFKKVPKKNYKLKKKQGKIIVFWCCTVTYTRILEWIIKMRIWKLKKLTRLILKIGKLTFSKKQTSNVYQQEKFKKR